MQKFTKHDAVVEHLGPIVRRLREKLNFSQTELGRRAGLHRTYISDCELDPRNFSLQTLNRLAHALGMKASKLVRLAELEISKTGESAKPKQERIVSANLGAVVKRLRQKAQLTQAELADQIGLAQSKICLLEKGHRDSVSLEVARKLARAFGLTLPKLRLEVEKSGQPTAEKRVEKRSRVAKFARQTGKKRVKK